MPDDLDDIPNGDLQPAHLLDFLLDLLLPACL